MPSRSAATAAIPAVLDRALQPPRARSPGYDATDLDGRSCRLEERLRLSDLNLLPQGKVRARASITAAATHRGPGRDMGPTIGGDNRRESHSPPLPRPAVRMACRRRLRAAHRPQGHERGVLPFLSILLNGDKIAKRSCLSNSPHRPASPSSGEAQSPGSDDFVTPLSRSHDTTVEICGKAAALFFVDAVDYPHRWNVL